MRRRLLSQWLLLLYIAAVHGIPALHLVWHKSDHVHDLGGIRWLTARRAAHIHVHATPHRAPHPDDAEASTVAKTARPQKPRAQVAADPSSGEGAPHLAIGPAHGQQSLLAPLTAVALAAMPPASTLTTTRTAPPRRPLFAEPCARAPPATV